MKIKTLFTKMLLVAAALGVGQNAWATTETFGSSKPSTKDVAITGTAINIAAGSNPSGTGSYEVFGVSKEKGLKLRTNVPLTFTVNYGYRITNITVKAYQNNNSTANHDMTCSGFSVDGTTYNFDAAKAIPYNAESTSTVPVVLSTGKISATNSVAFNFTNTSTSQKQIYAYVTVEYEEADYKEDFESTTLETLQSAWVKNDASWPDNDNKGTYASQLYLFDDQCENSTKWFCAASKNGSRQTTAYYYFASPYTGKAYQFDAKLNLNVGNNDAAESRLYFMNGDKKRNNEDPVNFIFYIGVNSSGSVFISNGTDSDVSTIGNVTGTENISNVVQEAGKNYKSTGWFYASCIIDFEKGNAKVTVTRNSSSKTLTVNLKSGTKQLSGLGVRDGAKTGGVVAMDNIALYELTYPAFTLSDTEKELFVDDNETITLTAITGDISVESDNTAVATVSYSDGTITINGVAEGTATITVTATNDGRTITKTIDVTVGGYAAKYTAAKAPYDTKVASLDDAGQAYWAANVTSAASVTNASEYSAAVAALPTTYVAAVKAQTTGGSDMTDAMPSALTDWTCNQGNGPGTYATTFTETYGPLSAFSTGDIMSQTITGLPNGYYKVQFYGVVNAARSPSVLTENTDGLAQAYANTTNEEITVYHQDACTPSDYLHTIEAQVTDGTLTYGLKVKGDVTDAGNWAVAKIYCLTYLGSTKYDYTINAVAGGTTIKQLASGNAWPSEAYGVYIPKVILYNGNYYVLDDADNENLDRYHASYTMGASNETKQINYTLDESIVFFQESTINSYFKEQYADNPAYSSGNTVECNYGGAGYNCTNARNRGINVGMLEAGIYSMNIVITGSGRSLCLRTNDGDSYNTGNNPLVSLSSTGTANFSLSSSKQIVITGANDDKSGAAKSSNPASYDYVIIRKLNVNDDPDVVGDINNATYYLEDMTDKVTLKPGESYNYKFVNHNAGGSSQWHNYVVPVYDSNGEKVLVVRSDNYEDVKGTNSGCSNDFVWGESNKTFISEMNGAMVDMTLAYSANHVFSLTAAITTANYNWTYSYTSDYTDSGISLDGNIQVALSVSNSWLELLSEGYAFFSPSVEDYATFSSAYPLDFSAATGVKAYYAEAVTGNTVSMTKITGSVAANTGLLLQKTDGAISIPVAERGDDLSATNLLKAGMGANVVSDGSYSRYVLAGSGSTTAFYNLGSAYAVPSGKAYLEVARGAGARLSIKFDDEDEVTGIKTIENPELRMDNSYNLQGQRVAQPTKGIFIVGGKKIVKK